MWNVRLVSNNLTRPAQRYTFRGRAAQLFHVLSDVLGLTSHAAAFINNLFYKYLVNMIDIYVGEFNVSSLSINQLCIYDLKLNRYFTVAQCESLEICTNIYILMVKNCLFKDFFQNWDNIFGWSFTCSLKCKLIVLTLICRCYSLPHVFFFSPILQTKNHDKCVDFVMSLNVFALKKKLFTRLF